MINRAQQQQETGRGVVVVPRRRFDGDDEEPTTAEAGCRCRSCAGVMVADCVALGCCPCAVVVSLLGLALVRAPLAVARRYTGRLRGRRRALLRGKRVRDVAAASASDGGVVREKGAKADVVGAADARGTAGAGEAAGGDDHEEEEEEELAWLEEMYRMGHWGFGRVSFSAKTL